MTELEILASTDDVFKRLLQEIPGEEKWDKGEIRTGLERAAVSISTFNPKNPMNRTLATAPTSWQMCLELGATAHCFGLNATALKESDPRSAILCKKFAEFNETEFRKLAKLLTEIGPASAGSTRGKR